MVTWGGFIAKMVEFLVTKWAGRKIDLALDDKKRTAWMFLRLHHALKDLSKLTKSIYQEMDVQFRSDDRSNFAWLSEVDRSVSNLSNEFFRIGDQLDEALAIFDPVLHHALLHLTYSKCSLLVAATEAFTVETDSTGNNQQIRYTYPLEPLINIDYAQHYSWLESHREIDLDKLEWPQTVLIGLETNLYISEGTVPSKRSPNYVENVAALQSILEHHGALLEQANSALAKFIRENFSIEDVLFSK